MTEEKFNQEPGALIGLCILTLTLGYVLGLSGVLSSVENRIKGDPEKRVGMLLQTAAPQLSDGEWAAMTSDVKDIRDSFPPEASSVFDLVVELHGLTRRGETDWKRAQSLCEGLKWTRCQKDALEELQRRSRP